MDTYHKIFLDNIERIYKNKPESCDTIEIEKVVDNIIPEMVSILKESLANSTREMLAEHRSLSEGFVSRNISRWGDAFNLFETLIVICTESGEEFNKSYRAQAVAENDLVFDLVVRHHARACHIANEILCL